MSQYKTQRNRTAEEFEDIRRQYFMYWDAYESILDGLIESEKLFNEVYLSKINDADKLDLFHVAKLEGIFIDAIDRISLEYTAAAPIEELKNLYPTAVDAYEAWCIASDDWYFHRHPNERGQHLNTPIEIGVASSYLELLRLLSLGVLFNEGAQLRRIAKLLIGHRNNEPDTVIEELLARFIPDAKEVDALHHFDLYDDLIGAAWEEDAAESAKCMTQFLKSWYKFFEGAPWHNAHLRFGDVDDSPDWANYYGYWAWEAGAIAYLYELDDSSYRNHLLYPKDLVDWARQQDKPRQPSPSASLMQQVTF